MELAYAGLPLPRLREHGRAPGQIHCGARRKAVGAISFCSADYRLGPRDKFIVKALVRRYMLFGKLKYLFIFTSVLLFCSIFNGLPYIYFRFLRITVTLSAIFYIILSYKDNKIVSIIFCAIAFLFNPLIPIRLSRETWIIYDIITGVVFLTYGYFRHFKPRRNFINTNNIVEILFLGTKEDLILNETIDKVCKILEMPDDFKQAFKNNLFRTDNDILYKTIKESKEPYIGWLFLFASNFAADNLETGRFHIYRGLLSVTGHELKSLFIKATRFAVMNGILDQETADNNVKIVNENIKRVG